MTVDMTCKYCGNRMKELKKAEIAGTIYHYLKCEKCKKEFARRDE